MISPEKVAKACKIESIYNNYWNILVNEFNENASDAIDNEITTLDRYDEAEYRNIRRVN